MAVAWGSLGPNPYPHVLFRDIACDSDNVAGIRDDGTILQWGDFWGGLGTPIPSGEFREIDGGLFSFAAIKTDGTLAAWGIPFLGNLDVPTGTFKAVSIGKHANVGIRTDGSLAVWGAGLSVPPLGNDYVAISAREQFALALRADGTVVGWGSAGAGLLNIPPGLYRGIAATRGYAAGIRDDGSVVFWGSSANPNWSMTGTFAQIDIGAEGALPVGLRTDGTLASLVNSGITPPSGTFGGVAGGMAHYVAVVPSPASTLIFLGLFGARRRVA